MDSDTLNRLANISHPMDGAEALVQITETLKESPVEPPKEVENPFPLDRMHCFCGAEISTDGAKVKFSGVVNFVEKFCSIDCAKQSKKVANVVCCNCKQITLVLKPRMQGGFEFKPGGYYHIAKCGFCDNTLEKAEILELEVHSKRNKK